MTPKQAECLKFIKSYIEQHGYSPSYADMLDHLGVKSKSGIHRIVSGLEANGKIRRVYGRSRYIEIVDDETMFLIQVIGDIRRKTGVGDKPMLSELADAIVNKYQGVA